MFFLLVPGGVIVMIQPWYEAPETEASSYDVTNTGSFINQLRSLLLSKSRVVNQLMYSNTSEVTSTEPPGGDDFNDDLIGYILTVTAGIAISFG